MADVHFAIDAVPTCHELMRMPHQIYIQRGYQHGTRVRSHQIKKAVEENQSAHVM